MLMTINPATCHASGIDTAPHPAAVNAGDAAGFASLLRQTQAAPAAPTSPQLTSKATAGASAPMNETRSESRREQPPAAPSGDAPVANEGEPAESPPTAPRPNAARKPLARDAVGNAADRAAARARDTRGVPASELAVDRTDTTADTGDASATPTPLPHANPPLDPCVMHWFAGQQRTGEPGDAATTTASLSTASEATPAQPTDAPGAPGSTSRRAVEPPDLEPKDKPVHARGLADDNAASTRAFGSALAAVSTSDSRSPTAAQAATTASPTPTTPFAPMTSPSNTIDTAATASIAAPLASPEFAQELGLALGVFVRDGVQQAELHLNPAEMGPVSVQIAIDGNQARIDFGADLAPTRHAIEQGLPALASALADAGFTLAGGGVSQQAQHSRSGSGDREAATRGSGQAAVTDDRLTHVASAARRIVTKGGLDVFA